MKKTILGILAGAALVVGCSRNEPVNANNTGRNVRDRPGDTLTAQDQPNNPADRDLTQRIRQAIVADNTMSMSAKNVKIITTNGAVTLRGPVTSQQEKANVGEKAQQIAGAGKVDNQLEIIAQ